MTSNSYPGPESIHRHELANGITLLIYENMSSDTISIEGVVRAGSVIETRPKAGLADFTADLLMRGTQKRTFDEIYEALESVGAGVSFGGSRHTSGFSGRSLVEDFDLVLDIIDESLCRPTFPDEQIERLRGQIITGLQMRANNTRQMAWLAFHETTYADHPFGRSVSGYLDTIPAITRQDIVDFYARHYGPQGMIIGVAGALPAATILGKIEAKFGGWRNDDQQPVGLAPDVVRPTGVRRRNLPMPEKHQADIVLGLPGPRRSAADYLDASLMNTILGVFGMMGRIGQNVREEQGLAYYASSRLEGGLGPGPWTASAGVAPDKVEQAIESIRHEIRRMMDEPVSAEELADSQAYRTGSMPMSLETNGGIVDIITDMELYDLGLDYLYRYAELINGITVERIQAAARKYLSADDLVIAVSGPIEAD
ncbi:Peptidase M16 family protein [Candidatus Promineifilum breve]|uniref:Peptidase M16 family protein n=1 Tax=Candidatus Promineifilum breve TaxID=1806508 RepID=A0A160T000_9CHLR|nr:pitrilysin family protein [Candidatus Promineifilum breve]CUS01998.2 Peptidase M16 family protein [Candidatus Promineifilum breve]